MSALIFVDVSALSTADLSAVDMLARLQLAARRVGTGIQLVNAPRELVALLQFIGLDDVLRVA